ncbi:MAG: hypothetical protein AAFO06_16005 [Cyanobacteria bacterium J06597_16]
MCRDRPDMGEAKRRQRLDSNWGKSQAEHLAAKRGLSVAEIYQLRDAEISLETQYHFSLQSTSERIEIAFAPDWLRERIPPEWPIEMQDAMCYILSQGDVYGDELWARVRALGRASGQLNVVFCNFVKALALSRDEIEDAFDTDAAAAIDPSVRL